MLARNIAELVSFPRLMKELGFVVVNERARRAVCILHGGHRSLAFSWRDQVWHCHSCLAGGDKFSIIQQVRSCDFKTALGILASIAGVAVEDGAKFKGELARARRERKKRESEEARLKKIERQAYLEVRGEVLSLERLRRWAVRRLAALDGWDRERFRGEEETAWATLQLVASQLPRAAAAYTLVSFANSETRLKFAQCAEERARLVDQCLAIGGVLDDKRHFRGFVL